MEAKSNPKIEVSSLKFIGNIVLARHELRQIGMCRSNLSSVNTKLIDIMSMNGECPFCQNEDENMNHYSKLVISLMSTSPPSTLLI